ncbi:MAG: Lrp/AsnC family transcriptional regulator [Methanomassiliicoccales archaeon]|nr:MAG: Lrp/AsnC family transcriptional regulator [Methanomassiliicoccales archaeon]
MEKNGGREKEEIPVHQGAPHGKFHSGLSSSELGEKDSEILSLTTNCPVTMLRISQKTDIPFVECLFRARNLQDMGLLRKLSDKCNAHGLYLYLAEERRV